MLRMQSGSLDVMTQADVRPEDIASLRRLRDQGAVQLAEPGVGVDPIMLWFNLTPAGAAKLAKTKPYLQRAEFRQAISYAVDREALANTLYLGAAVPVYGPVTPGNRDVVFGRGPEVSRTTRRAPRRCSPGSASPIATATGCSRTPRDNRSASRSLTQTRHIRGRTADGRAGAAAQHRHRRGRRRARPAIALRPRTARATTTASATASRRARSIRR